MARLSKARRNGRRRKTTAPCPRHHMMTAVIPGITRMTYFSTTRSLAEKRRCGASVLLSSLAACQALAIFFLTRISGWCSNTSNRHGPKETAITNETDLEKTESSAKTYFNAIGISFSCICCQPSSPSRPQCVSPRCHMGAEKNCTTQLDLPARVTSMLGVMLKRIRTHIVHRIALAGALALVLLAAPVGSSMVHANVGTGDGHMAITSADTDGKTPCALITDENGADSGAADAHHANDTQADGTMASDHSHASSKSAGHGGGNGSCCHANSVSDALPFAGPAQQRSVVERTTGLAADTLPPGHIDGNADQPPRI